MRYFWPFLFRPLLDWFVVSLAFLAIQKILEAKAISSESARAVTVPMEAKMAELAFEVTRADGSKGPSRTYRNYRNPLRRWAWAFKTAFSEGA